MVCNFPIVCMHIHIPDGVLPIWLWVLGYALAALFLLFAVIKVGKDTRKAVWTAAVAAMMLVAMSIPLGVPYHINLTALAGIILGPWWSLIACFVVNGILASFGHGGVTIVGLNTLVTWFEALAGFYLYRVFKKVVIKDKEKTPVAAGVSTWIALTLSAFLVIGLVAASGIESIPFHGGKNINLNTFTILTLTFALPGAVVEAVITAFILAYIRKVRPELFG